ncbi:hypothetical protein NDS46_31715 (plasmid) [Paenibacillus thiaminolyticus]|uniref:hypothetical protein n=1 Tax=Paenibacillus thiaminolyticus TaxID=49283 RepID=UPI002330BCCE|nr:hypothetical protein [Paenibacillus thiaminolyticus]WCF11527.1 hypothetical protein NDS46_31715 [Paenibacillus thiaminolyticus]
MVNHLKVAAEFVDQTLEFLINDINRNLYSGRIDAFFEEYELESNLRQICFEEKWSQEKFLSFRKAVIDAIKTEFLPHISKLYHTEMEENYLDYQDMNYYLNKEYLNDDTIEDDEDLSEEKVASYINDFKKSIAERKPKLEKLEKLLLELKQ